ncbi:MAG: response regulator [Pseudomonadota bacterium]|nr:response regulator [Pseudomonadota bacterium]
MAHRTNKGTFSAGEKQAEGAKATVLIVEDEAFARLYAAQLFEDEGYAVLEAADAQEGLTLLEAHPEVALLFTDIRLPGELDGLALADTAKELRPELALMLTSGYVPPSDFDRSGCGAFLAKPYTASSLLQAARALLSRTGIAGTARQ